VVVRQAQVSPAKVTASCSTTVFRPFLFGQSAMEPDVPKEVALGTLPDPDFPNPFGLDSGSDSPSVEKVVSSNTRTSSNKNPTPPVAELESFKYDQEYWGRERQQQRTHCRQICCASQFRISPEVRHKTLFPIVALPPSQHQHRATAAK
jgi:hypothetical protein